MNCQIEYASSERRGYAAAAIQRARQDSAKLLIIRFRRNEFLKLGIGICDRRALYRVVDSWHLVRFRRWVYILILARGWSLVNGSRKNNLLTGSQCCCFWGRTLVWQLKIGKQHPKSQILVL